MSKDKLVPYLVELNFTDETRGTIAWDDFSQGRPTKAKLEKFIEVERPRIYKWRQIDIDEAYAFSQRTGKILAHVKVQS